VTVYFLIAAGLAGLYMAFNIGANDTANSMASAVGARALTLRQAVVVAGVLEFTGAYFVGAHVTQTIRKGVISPAGFETPQVFALALLAAVLGAALWVFYSTWKEMPVSTTHSIVGAIIGVGIVSGGGGVVSWRKVMEIAASWVISPVFSGVLAFSLFRIINRYLIIPENSALRTRRAFPVFIFLSLFIILLSMLFKTPLGKKYDLDFATELFYSGMGSLVLTAVLSLIFVSRLNNYEPENVFRYLQILTSCYVAFAHGANDVANAIGPLSGIYSIFTTGEMSPGAEVPGFMLMLGGLGISAGIFFMGYRVIKTVGYSITELTNTRGFSIDFAAATGVLAASKLGLPVSTTHAAVGAVIGIGIARGLEAIDLRIVRRIIFAWFFTLPVAAVLAAAIFIIIKQL